MRNTLLILLTIHFFSLKSQSGPQPNYIQYSTDEGMPSSEVYCSFEDSHGFMWFGTDNGVSRFDGYDFKNFGPNEGLLQNVIFNIHEDKLGRIWFGSITGEVFYLDKNEIKPAKFNKAILSMKNKFSHAHLFYIDENDHKYIHLHGYATIVVNNNKIIHYENVYGTQIFHKDEITFLCKNFKIEAQSSKQAKNFIRYHDSQRPRSFVKDFQTVANSTELIKDSLDYILLINDHNCFKYSLDGELILKKTFLSKGTNDIIQSQVGNLLIALKDKKGLYVYGNDCDLFGDCYPLNYLNGYSINNLFFDKFNNLWIATSDDGIILIPKFNESISQILKKDHFTAVTVIKKGKSILTGNTNGIISEIDNQGQELSNIKQKYYSKIFDIYYNEKKMKIYTENGTIDNKIFNPFKYKNTSIQGKGLTFSKNSNKLIGIHHLGLSFINPITNEIRLFSNSNAGIRARPYSVYSSYKNKILIGYSDGLFEYKDSKLYRVTEEEDLKLRIEDIDELSDSTLVLGTKGNGVILWKDSITYKFNTSHGLAADMIEDIHISDGDTIWVSTLNGLSRIVKEDDNPVRTFTKSSGLPTNEIYQVDTYNGIAYLATAKGLIKFLDPPLDTFSMAPTITDLIYKDVKYTTKDKINIPYEKNEFEINYVTLNFEQLGDIDYRFKILDSRDWSKTSNTSAFFTNLSPGNYNFQVQSKNPDGYWSNTSSLAIRIDYPWYQTWFACFIYSMITLSIVYFLIQIRTEHVNKVNGMKSRMLDLEKQALSAQMNPHFIFNCLNSIQNFIIKDNTKDAVYYLTRFAQLTRDILEISVEGQNSIEKEVELLDNYLTLEKLRFKGKFNFTINKAVIDNEEDIEIPSMVVQPFVENSVIHGMKTKTAGGFISVDISKQEDKIVAIIQDNGPGLGNILENIQKEKELELESPYMEQIKKTEESADEEFDEKIKERKSYGVDLTSKRLNILDPEFIDEQIQTIELKENDLIIGTKVIINLPIIKKRK